MTTAKVFVGSLPPGCKPEELRHLFTSYGNVVECDIMNRCGFVHLETVEMADAAIAALNGVEFKGQNIVVEPGRLKDRRGGGGGGGGNAGGGGGAGSNRRPNMQGSNFSRGDHHSGSFRGGRGGGATGNSRSDSHFGPVRNEGHFRQQRNAPYSKGHNQSYEGSTQGGYKNKFSQGSQGQMSHSDYQSGGGGGGGAGSHRGGGFRGQDRRGFALPTVDHHHQQQQQQLGRYGNGGPIGVVPSGSSPSDNGMFQANRSHSSSTQGGRGGGGFNASRGGYVPRGGGFAGNNRRGGGTSSSSHGGSFNNNKHAAANGHHQQQHAPNSYQSDFPPLGSSRNRFNGPRPAPHMGGGGNRRF